VPEDSRVLRERRFWFPTSDCLETWLIRRWKTPAQWRLPKKKRVSTQEKSEFGIALRFSNRKSRSCAQI